MRKLFWAAVVAATIVAAFFCGIGRTWDPLVAVVLAGLALLVFVPALAYFTTLLGTLGFLRACEVFNHEVSQDDDKA